MSVFYLSFFRFSPKFEPLKSKILANTEISINHLTPEIRLRLITPACAIYHQTIDDNFVFKNSDPFWGFYWAGGQGMSRYILDHPEVVRDKLVLDFGSGSGVCAIASMMSGASKAVANDIDEGIFKRIIVYVMFYLCRFSG